MIDDGDGESADGFGGADGSGAGSGSGSGSGADGGGDGGSGSGAGSGSGSGDGADGGSGSGTGDDAKATDWEVCGVAGGGGAAGIAGGASFWIFRSALANRQGQFLFVGAGAGVGGDLGGATAPSPGDVASGQASSSFTALQCATPFSINDLNVCSGRVTSAGAGFAYGYSLCYITAGTFPNLFASQSVGGWNVGVGANASVLLGVWKLLGSSSQYTPSSS